ncbi:hypothetical protein K1719_016753 [Acacia pycnantha]|nr:hypothetical protein K1719_040386 [Acacia pycnantha]KAI9112230.1 hypothetical protein K1719_016753 [Acacia pycnantha]
MADPTEEAIKSSNLAATMMTRQRSTRQQVGDAIFVDEKLKPQLSRPGSSRMGSLRSDSIRRERVVTFRDSNINNDDDDDEDGDGQMRRPKEGRQMSAREAVAAQEAAEAAAAEEEEEEDEDEGPFGNGGGGGGAVTMSLMDLLEETDRQMGLQGSTYRMDFDEDDDYDDFDEDEDDDYEEGEEHDCCVCMVKHRGASFEPCGHSFCRMCSRELIVSKGNCPLCNNFILEILEVF